MRLVVRDTSPIRALVFLDQIVLLKELFGEVLIPPAVARELTAPRSKLPPISLSPFPFLRVQAPTNEHLLRRFQAVLDAGESEAIALALEVGAEAILIDEREGRKAAKREGMTTIGAIGVLVRGKNAGLLPLVGPLLDRLENELKFFVSDAFRREALELAGE